MEQDVYSPIRTILPVLTESTKHYLMEEYEAEEKEYNQYHRMSSLGFCHRSRLWSKQGVKTSNPRNVSNLMRTVSGEWMHNFYYSIWDKSLVEGKLTLAETEKTVYLPQFNLKGHLDAILEYKEGDTTTKLVVDLKSQDPNAFRYQKKEGDQKKEYQEMQVGGYCWGSGIGVGLLWKFEPVYFTEGLFPVILDDILKGKITEDMTQILATEKETDTAPIDYVYAPNKRAMGKDGKIWECNYCEYKDKCFALDPEVADKVKESGKKRG